MFGFFAKSRQKAKPVTLYLFTYGDAAGSRYGHTDSETPISYKGVDYTPFPITHGNIIASGTLDNVMLDVKTTRKCPTALLFETYPPTSVVTLRIMKGNANDTDPTGTFVTVWFGEVKSCKLEKSQATFSCEPISMRLMNPGLRRNYQIGCNHALYSRSCKVEKLHFEQEASIVSIHRQTITFASGWNAMGIPESKFLSGMVRTAGRVSAFDYRVILRVNGPDSFDFGGIPLGVEVGANVKIYPGCDHMISDCTNLFNNVHNFGGCPWIPYDNPVGVKDNFF